MNITNDELLSEFKREITELSRKNIIISLQLTPDHAMALIGAIQLACRHPAFTGPASQVARRIAERMQSDFLQYDMQHILEVIRRGWQNEYDEKS